ncbi:MAG: HlyD family secretion protein [Fluviicola sp.]|jgi:adhesin transport system membrane fusion protein
MKRFNEYASISHLETLKSPKRLKKTLSIVFLLLFLILFLPWTQNVQSIGAVTAVSPNNRPQLVNAVIGGKIEKWFVQEGQYVKKGDTIAFLSEVKAEYMDPDLVKRTEEQMRSKEGSVGAYMGKVQALDQQIDAMIDNRIVKLNQAQNKIKQLRYKITSDSADYRANEKLLKTARDQFERANELYEKGQYSLTQMETRKIKVQEMEAKVVSLENKLLTSRNELINATQDLSAIDADYRDKIAKSESEKSSALSSIYDAEATVTKMQNQVANYSARSGFYYVTAPQNGYISQALKNGIGEIIKEGSPLVSIVPETADYGVEIFVSPYDLPLIHVGNDVQLQFDGWPAIVFSGWPSASVGMFQGKVIAVDNFVSENGKYRVLVAPDKSSHKWPDGLRMGVAVKSMVLLNDVPIWYELWRQMNGFPANYYTPKKDPASKSKKK